MNLQKKIGLFIFSIVFIVGCTSQSKKELVKAEPKNSPLVSYDSLLVKKLGADQYGMKKYVMAFLKAGPNRSQDKEKAAQLQKAHLENINRMAQEGRLVVAGPFLDDGDIRGIYIFNVETVEEARKLTETDPAVIAGRLVMELHPWYGSAALMQVNEIHKRIEMKNVAEE